MKYVKMLGLLAVAAAALMAFAGSASATELTGPAGKLGVGSVIKATSTNSKLTGSVEVACKHSSVEGKITNAGGAGVTVEGSIEKTKLTFTECNGDTVEVLNGGTLIVHTQNPENNGNGIVTSTGAEVTIQLHRIVLGFPVTTHCIYVTNATDIGHLTGGTPAVLDINSSPIPRKATDGACGESSIWTGNYTVTSPTTLIVH